MDVILVLKKIFRYPKYWPKFSFVLTVFVLVVGYSSIFWCRYTFLLCYKCVCYILLIIKYYLDILLKEFIHTIECFGKHCMKNPNGFDLEKLRIANEWYLWVDKFNKMHHFFSSTCFRGDNLQIKAVNPWGLLFFLDKKELHFNIWV